MSKAHLGIKLLRPINPLFENVHLMKRPLTYELNILNYWIGFLMADGNVSYKKGIPIIALHLNAADLPQLLKFREFVGSSHTIGKYLNKLSGNTSYSISFSSERLSNVLARYGFVPESALRLRSKAGLNIANTFGVV